MISHQSQENCALNMPYIHYMVVKFQWQQKRDNTVQDRIISDTSEISYIYIVWKHTSV